jgi:hypothetical protein
VVPKAALPPAVAAFVDEHVDTVSSLECMLWMKRRGDRGASTLELARDLRMGAAQAAHVLSELARTGVIRPAGLDRWQYAGGPAGVDEALEWLAEHFGRYRVSVIERIFSKPVRAPEGEH